MKDLNNKSGEINKNSKKGEHIHEAWTNVDALLLNSNSLIAGLPLFGFKTGALNGLIFLLLSFNAYRDVGVYPKGKEG